MTTMVVVPAEALASVLEIVDDIVLDGETPDNQIACAVAHDVVALNDHLPEGLRREGLRERLVDLLSDPRPWA